MSIWRFNIAWGNLMQSTATTKRTHKEGHGLGRDPQGRGGSRGDLRPSLRGTPFLGRAAFPVRKGQASPFYRHHLIYEFHFFEPPQM